MTFTPYLVSDINQTSYGSNPRNFISAGGFLYFIADNDINGTELWKVDQTTGVASIVEINSGSGSSNPNYLTNVNGTLYFQAYDPTNGYELWKIGTNGTATIVNLGNGGSNPNYLTNVNGTLYFQAYTPTNGYELWKIDPSTGTPSVIDIISGGGSSYPNNLINANGVLYFTAETYNGANYLGQELWRIDPTTGSPVFLKDIQVGSGSPGIGNLTYSNGKLYFTADNFTNGLELWETDGTASGTRLTQDINQTTYSSNPRNFINVGGTLYFVADNDVNGTELWKSDPTTGVVSVVEINAGSGNSNPTYLTNINGTLYFQAYDPTNGYELWKIGANGTPTIVNLGNGGSNPNYLTNVNGTLYFQAYAPTNGYELWKIDPTTGTPIVIDIVSGSGSSSPYNLTNVNGILYFTASTSATGYELWKLDPANDLPVLVSDIYSGSNSSNPNNFIISGGTVYFIANNGTNGTELFRINPTTGNPVLLDIRTGASSSNPNNLIDVNGTLYFIANDGVNGSELWKVEPTTGTPVLLEINPGSSSANISYLTNVNGTLYFSAYDNTNGYELWKIGTNGTPTRIDLGSGSASPNYLTNINGTLYFAAYGYNGANYLGYELWKIDPTTGNPVVIDIVTGSGSSDPRNFTNVNGTLFFSAYDNTSGYELWKLDSNGNPVLVKDIRTGGNSSSPSNLFNVNGTLYFTADNGISGLELWKSDGTAEGTVLAKDVNGRTFSSNPNNLIDINGTLYFIANDGVNGSELWKVDPTTGNPVLLEINPGSSSASINYLTNVNGTLYFRAYDNTNGYELWKIGTNGTPTRIDLGTGESYPDYLTNINGTLYFAAGYYSGANYIGYELWKIDPTTGNPVVIDIVTGSGSSYPTNFTNVNGTLFFQAYNPTSGYELWKLDSNGNPVLVKDIRTGGNSSSPSNLFNVNGTLYFTADNGISGLELWKSDGTAEGTVLAKDVNGRTFSSNPNNLIDINGTLYFIANDGINGSELWKVDPTTGTPVLLEINPGSSSASINYLTNVNGTLYFRAYDNTNGNELWKIGANGTPTRIDLGSGGSEPNYLTNINGTLYFAAGYYNGANYVGYELWKIDPTTGNPVVIDIVTGSGSSDPSNFTNVNGTLFFSAYNPTNGYELWKLDSNGSPVLVKDIRTGGNSSSPSNLFNVNGTLYFTANDGTNGTELWKSDGTTAGTVQLEIYPGVNSPNINNLINVAGVLYFTANNGTNGQELWRINSTTGNPEVIDINSGSGSASPNYLTNVNGTLYFQAYDPTNGSELWKIGTNGTATIVNLGNGGSNPNYLTNVNGTLYFQAYTQTNGYELWKIDPSTGTPSVIDIISGGGSSYPNNLINANGVLYFTAETYNGANYLGQELWRIDPTTGNAVFLKDIQVGSGSPGIGNLTYSNGKLYFTADNFTNGVELWTVDVNSVNTVGSIAKTGNEDQIITFVASDFSSVFSSSGGTSLAKIQVVQLPSNGLLKLGTNNVTVNQEIAVADLGNLTFVPNANFNGTAGFTWNGSDGTAYAANPSNVIFTINSVNDVPEVINPIPNVNFYSNSSSNFTFSENTFRDVDLGDSLTYSATLGDGSQLPSWLTFNGRTFSGTPPISSAGQIEIKVTATDQNNTSATDNFILNVINSAPNYIYLSNNSIAENSDNGTVIGTLSSADANTNDAHTYTLINDAGGRFALNSNQLVVGNGGLLDYETATAHTIRVKTTDSSGLSYEQDIAISISNVNDAFAGALSFTSASYSVNEIGTPIAIVTVQRTGGSEGFVRADILLSNGTATYPNDYNAVSVSVNFANGETSKTVTIPIVNDAIAESNETINLTLANPQGGATLDSPTTAVLTIIDNDSNPSLSLVLNLDSINETQTATGTITRNTEDISSTLIVTLSSSDTTEATVPQTVTIPVNQTSATFTLTAVDDQIFDANQTVTITAAATGFNSGTDTITIRNIDLPDLVVSNIVAPVEAFSGQSIEVVWTLTNQGNAEASGTWTDNLYLSEDEVAGNDQFLNSFSFTGSIAAGATIERRQVVNLPLTLSGDRRLVLQTDAGNQILERPGTEGNNTTVDDRSIQIRLSSFPNLQVSSITPPTTAFSGLGTEVVWTVTNTGDAATNSPYWRDEVWLSRDSILDSQGDYFLGSVTNPTYLGINESYTNRLSVTLPRDISGDWRFIVRTDASNSVVEYPNDGDNTTAASTITNVELTPPADLRVTNISLAPTRPFSGQQATITWRVTNTGTGATPPDQTRWNDEIIMTENADGTGETFVLGSFQRQGSLAAGAFYDRTQTVNLPIGKWGEYFFSVRTDRNNQVFESAFENNNILVLDTDTNDTEPTPTTVLLTPPPDLVVDSITVPANIVAGQLLTVRYRVLNEGLTATPGSTSQWTDVVYLSPTATFNSNTAISLGTVNRQGILETQGGYDINTTFTVPNDVTEGNYYLIVVADAYNRLFEQDDVDAVQGSNVALPNVLASTAPINVLSRPADLIVSEVTAPSIANAGSTARLSWTVRNTGTGSTPVSQWRDRLIASVNNTLGDSDDVTLATFERTGSLAVNGTYTRTEDVLIPFVLSTSTYNLFVTTDADDVVYESLNNNNSNSTNFQVNRLTPDLEVVNVTAPATASSGDLLTVSWTVKNTGAGATNVDYWYDEVYLSTDTTISSGDLFLGSVRRGGILGINDTYTVNASFGLPINLQGTYNVIVRTDNTSRYGESANRVIEISETNNSAIATPASVISLSPVADLQVTQVNPPGTAISGQSFILNWQVQNLGAAATGNRTWTDNFYLSIDQVFDRNSDIYLGGRNYTGNLGVGAVYNGTQTVNIPRGLAGNYYVFVVTDVNNAIEERANENNNITLSAAPTQVIIPPPSDLNPVASSITLPTAGVVGQPLTISYSVQNLGNAAAIGSWVDTVYLSQDAVWDVNDLVVGTYTRTGSDLAAGATYNGSVTNNLPAVVPGNYYAIVRSDARNQAPESNETNNTVTSLGQINVDVPVLTVGGNASGTLATGQAVYYKLQATAGQAIRLQLDSADNTTTNQVYVRYGEMPTRGQFDVTDNEPFTPDPDFVLSANQTGTYYILVYGNTATGTPSYTLTATDIPFSVFDVSADLVGNDGVATIKIDGAKFGNNTTFALIDSQGNAIAQSKSLTKDSTTAFATFDLTDKAIGSYSLRAIQGSEVVTLANAVQVQQGDLVDDFSTNITGPRAVWAGQKYPVNIAYGNGGDSDISAPLLLVRPVNNNAAIGYTPRYNASEERGQTVQLLGAGKDLGLTQLRPGESYTVPVFYTHLGGDESAGLEVVPISRYDSTAISTNDWLMLRDTAKPTDITDTDWNNFWAAKQPGIGNTWGDYVELVTELSTAYSGTGNPITDVQDLFSRWYSDQAGVYDFQPKSTVSGRLLGPNGTPLKEVRLDVVRVLPDGNRVGIQSSTEVITDENGRFAFQGLEAGNYEVTIAGSDIGLTFLPTADGLTDLTPGHLSYGLTVTSGQNQSNLDIQTYQPSNPDFVADRQIGQKQVSLVRDGDGVSHIFWVEDNQLWHSYFDGSQWIDAAPIAAAQPETNYKVQASSSLLGGNADLIVTWDERTDDPNNPVPGDTEVFYALGRVKAGGGYEWSNQVAVTPNDNVIGAVPALLLDGTGSPLFVYQQYDGAVENDDSDLYYQLRSLSSDTITWGIGAGQNGSISWSYAAGAEIHLPDVVGNFIPVTHIKISGQYSGSSTTSCDKTVIQGGWNARGEISNKTNTVGNVRDRNGKGEFKITGGGSGAYGAVYEKNIGMTQKRSQAGGNLGFETTIVPGFLGPVANVLRAAQNVVSWLGGDLETGTNGSAGVNRVNLQSPTGWRENWAVNLSAGVYGKLKFGPSVGRWSAKPPTFFEFKLSGAVTGALSLTTGSSQTSRVGRISGRIGARAVAELKVAQFSLGPVKFEPIVVSAGIEGFITFPDCNAVFDVWSNPLTSAASQPTIGTTTIYGSNAILSGVGEDVYNDSSAVLTLGQNGLSYMAWSKQFYDSNQGAGEAVTIATFDGSTWSDPVTLARNAMLRGLDISTAANGRPLVLWSMADETAFVLPQDPTTIDSIEEVAALTEAVAKSTNLFYATVDAAGNWSAPVRLANLDGIDQGVKLGQTSDGQTIATWTNTNGTVTTLQTAFWNGTTWTTPTAIATGNLAAPTVGQLGSQTAIFWSQLQPVQGSTEPEEVLFYSLLDNTTGQWTTPSLFTPVLAGGQGVNLSENPSNVISLLGEDRFAPPPEDCEPPYDPPQLRSADPNDILGPVGFGAENWVTPNEPFGYTIRFENMATATAPAKLVTITQQLDPDLDWRSFRLGAFNWGDIIVEIPENRPFYTERLDVREKYGVYVDFTAFIDITTGIASWELRAIDPATGSLPTDPLLGFLPPNGTTPEDKGIGEGYVTYSIKTKRNVTHGARIDAEAEIIFDTNEPIKTPAIFNTIDAIKPTATIQPLPANVVGDTFTLNWGGSDNEGGSGLAYYDIYVSVNDAPYELLLGKTTQTELTITGELGNTYKFIAVGKDNAQSLFCYRCEGLVDPDAPTSEATPQASIVLGTAGEIAFSQTQFQVNESGGAIAAVTLTRTGGSFGEVSVTLTPSDGTAIGGTQPFATGVDFDNQPLVVTFANGEQSKIVNLPINADNLIEGAETLTLALSNVTGGATLGSQTTATLTIVDDTSQIAFADTSFRFVEGETTNYIQLVRTGNTANAVGATLNFSNGTAIGGSDFNNSAIAVNFAANETTKTIAIPVTNDTITEGIETLNLSLSNPTGGAALGNLNSAIATIVDDETDLKLNLTADAGMSAQVVAAFTQAANRWATLLNNDVTINLNIAFRDMGTGTVGQTSSLRNNFTYTEVHNALNANGVSADDSLAIANLPTGNALNLLLNRTTNSPFGNASPTPYLDNDGDANNTTVRLNRANAKALGLIAADNANPDATIIFNSNAVVNWDFDPSNGISEGAFDFVGMAMHEFAHALGFDSGVDVLDTNPATTDDKLTFVSSLDLFRFSTVSYSYGAGTIDWTANDTDKYFSLDGGATKIASFATGRTYGDGYQPSHWKDGLNLGLLDPTTNLGEGLQVSTLDLRALDVIGWNLSNTPVNNAPTDINLSASSIAENQPIGAVIGTFSSIDPDANNTFTYSLVAGTGSQDNAAFTIVGNELRLAVSPDFETKTTYSIRVSTSDQDGLSYEKALAIAINNVNEAPVITTPITDQTATEDSTFTFQVPADKFTDVDAGDSLSYSASLENGTALPNWLTFNTTNRTFSGTPTNSEVGTLNIQVSVTDQSGASVNDVFTLTVNNTNDAPILGSAIADQIATQDTAFTFVISANTFSDIDVGDTLTYSATLDNGNALPSWLTFNATTLTFSGTPANTDVGTLNIAVIATDNSNASISDNFALTITNLVNNIVGTAGNDTLNGTANNDNIQGLGGNDTISDLAGNDTLDGGTGADNMSGGLNDDTYIVDNSGDRVRENPDEGIDTVRSSISYTLAENVENLILIGTSNISGTGNSLNNIITGNAGSNSLDGKAGDDTMSGGAGNDTYTVDSINDTIIEQLNQGTDTVNSSVNWTLGDNLENLTLTGSNAINGSGNGLRNTITGNSASNSLSGGDNDDTLRGNAGNDTLDGGAGNDALDGGVGDDTMSGGVGNDTYTVDSINDTIIEQLNQGTDTVNSSVNWTLGDNLENLTLTGSNAINGSGNGLRNTITGNSASNSLSGGDNDDTLRGNAGNDTLDGGAGNDALDGGVGDDAMSGGVGNDIYTVDSINDTITEQVNEGTDTVNSSVSWTLGDNLENLTLTGSNAINGSGNGLKNIITGNSASNSLSGDDENDTLRGNAGNDTLDGGAGNDALDGGVGDDAMSGGVGNDIYTVDSINDTITEQLNQGTDTVNSSVSWTLEDNLENLTLTGSNVLNGSGNELKNTITGNSAGNSLSGGDDDDSLNGGSGNDTLDGGNGNDTLIGGTGNDILVGGANNDKLTGGSGLDIFDFLSPITDGIDTITDFSLADDKIRVNAAGFGGGLVAGNLDPSQFFLGSAAADESDRFIYNKTTGTLLFDADGTGSTVGVQIATLSNKPTISSANIVVI